MTLRTTIDTLVNEFAEGILHAIRQAHLEELVAETRGPTVHAVRRGRGRPKKVAAPASKGPATAGAPARAGTRRKPTTRRTSGDGAELVEAVVDALQTATEGLRSEHLQHVLSRTKAEIARAVTQAMAEKRVRKIGHTRSTTYFATR